MKLLRWRHRKEQDLQDEIHSHLQMAIRDQEECGATKAEAECAARREFGNVELVKEITRDTWEFTWLDRLVQDFRFGLRTFRRSPGFTAVAVLTLGVALAASAIMFSIINCVLLLPLPYKDSDRLVRIYSIDKMGRKGGLPASGFLNLLKRNHSFQSVAAYFYGSCTITGGDFPEEVNYLRVTPDYFSVFGVAPMLGRVIQDQDINPKANYTHGGAPPDGAVTVLSYGFWQRRFGSDSSIIGKTLYMEGKPVSVVGVLPFGFQMTQYTAGPGVDCWLPQDPAAGAVSIAARLRSGASLPQAQAEVSFLAKTPPEKGADSANTTSIIVVSLQEAVVGNVRQELMLLLGAVLFVLLVACGNISNMLIARGICRQKEMAIRSAVGASRVRLIRQLLTESILLFLFGGTLGVLLALWCKNAVIAFAPKTLPRVQEIAFDARAFGFTLAAALLTGIACGLIPALRTSRTDLPQAIKEGIPTSGGGVRRWFGNSVVTCQIALVFMLLIASGLMIRTFIRMQAVPLGFDYKNVILMDVNPPRYKSEWENSSGWLTFTENLFERIKNIPGIELAAIGTPPLVSWGAFGYFVSDKYNEPLWCGLSPITPDYFRVLKVRLLEGRLFTGDDRPGTPRVAIVNQTAAKLLWPGGNPLGRSLTLTDRSKTKQYYPIQVVGRVEDIKMAGLDGAPLPSVFTVLAQNKGAYVNMMLMRTRGDASTIMPSLRKALQDIDKDTALTGFEPLSKSVDQEFAGRRFSLLLISIFGALAFILATIGIYTSIAYSVSRRTHEIGIRMALGAQRKNVLTLILKQGVWMMVVGETIGLAGALALNHLMGKMVFGVTTTDTATYVAVLLSWATVAFLASYIPAARAARIDPLQSLRRE